jgi:hypothetical protein
MTLQDQLDTYTEAVAQSREAVGTIGGTAESESQLVDTSELQQEFMDSLLEAAITNQIRLSDGETPVTLDRILRIEHQTWLRGTDVNGDSRVINLMDVTEIATTNGA